MRGSAGIHGFTMTAMALTIATLLAGCSFAFGKKAGPEPDAAARDAARNFVDEQVAALRRTPGLSPLARVEVDECVRGQRDWKIRDPYTSRCTLRVVAAFTFASDFVVQARTLDRSLRGSGWTARQGITEILAEYWAHDHDQAGYTPGSLPAARYEHGGQVDSRGGEPDPRRRLEVSFASADTRADDLEKDGATVEEIDLWRERDLEYHHAVTGTPWAQPWQAARKPGTYLVVLSFREIYQQT